MKRSLCLVPALMMLSEAIASAQVALERFDRQLEQIRRDTRLMANPDIPAEQRTFFDFGGYTTFNYLSLDDPQLNNRGLRQYDVNAYARLNLDGIHDVLVRGSAFYKDFNPGDSFDEHGDVWDGRLDRAYYRFDLAAYLAARRGQSSSADIAIKVGRDLAHWGNGLTLSQPLDGAVVDLTYGATTLQMLGGITPLDSVDIDSSRPNFDDHSKRGFYGALLSTRVGAHRPFIFALAQRDYNNDVSGTDINDDGISDIATRFDYNSNYLGFGSAGAISDKLAYGVEFVLEAGDSLSNSFAPSGATIVQVPQSHDDIRAWALDLQLDYLPGDAWRTRVGGEMILASGDDDRLITSNTFGGNATGTNDHAFNAFGLINTGLAFAPRASNLIALRGGVSTYPFTSYAPLRQMQLGTDLFIFAKLREHAPIDEPTDDARFLGIEPDLYLNWQITSDVTLALRYGAFIPGTAIQNDGKIRQLIYAGVTFAF